MDGVDGDDEREEDDVDEETRLKYQRMGGNLPALLSNDAASCIAVAARVIALGTQDGTVHILDFLGNQMKEFRAHTAPVNDINFDTEGQYVGSCSDDGSVVINSLFTDDKKLKFNYNLPMKAISFNPDFTKKQSKRFVAGGLAGHLYMNCDKWYGYRDQVLHSGEGPIHSVKWRGKLIAWANDAGVRVYDTAKDQCITLIERPQGSLIRLDVLLPHLVWHSDTLLVIGWGTSVKIVSVMSGGEETLVFGIFGMFTALRPYQLACFTQVDIVASFQTSYYISGIVPFGDSLFILAYIPIEEHGAKEFSSTTTVLPQGNAQRPEVRIVSWKNDEFTMDVLPVLGFEDYKAKDYSLAHVPFPGSSYDGGELAAGDEPFCYIFSPKEVVIVKPRGAEGPINWLWQHGFHEKALVAIEAGEGRTELIDKVVQLMLFDCCRATALFVENRDLIAPSQVVMQLLTASKKCDSRFYLYLYLHELFEVCPNTGKDFHDMQVELYSEYDAEMVLPFLHSSQYYKLEKAYEICVKKDLLREQVFVLGRMGNAKQAVAVIINKLGDIEAALKFVSMQQADDLWEELIKQCLNKPEMVGLLLEHKVGNPLYILNMVPNISEIPRLRDRFVKIVTDYRTEISLRHGWNDILKTGVVNLEVKCFNEARRGVYLSFEEDHYQYSRTMVTSRRCCMCFQPVLTENIVVVFFCCHVYHKTCLMEVEKEEEEEEDNENFDGDGPQQTSLRCILCTILSENRPVIPRPASMVARSCIN